MSNVLAGVVKDPVQGYQQGGMLGLGQGAVQGAACFLLKPMAGVLEFTSKTVSGVESGIRTLGDAAVNLPRTRVRAPRTFGYLSAYPTGTRFPEFHAVLHTHQLQAV